VAARTPVPQLRRGGGPGQRGQAGFCLVEVAMAKRHGRAEPGNIRREAAALAVEESTFRAALNARLSNKPSGI
jgi:hypothetical protein